MVWKFVLGMVLLVTVVNTRKNRCERIKDKLDMCRYIYGYVIGDCEHGENEMTKKIKTSGCRRKLRRYKRRCGDYQCEPKDQQGLYKNNFPSRLLLKGDADNFFSCLVNPAYTLSLLTLFGSNQHRKSER
jgi:hypothetical protein